MNIYIRNAMAKDIDEKITGAAIFSCEQDEVYKKVTW